MKKPGPKKSWSQNFLADRRTAGRIAEAAADAAGGSAVLELGAGTGALTLELSRVCRRVIALERDRDLVPILRASLGGAGNVEVVEGNALMVDAGALRGDGEGPLCVAGNLPYHIASQIIFRLLDQRAHVKSMVLMLQKEMAQRAAAEPGTRESGVLSVLCRVHSEPRILFDVGPGAFRPAPKVVSSVVRFDIRPSPLVDPVLEPAFRRVVKAAFGQRRKTLRNALRPLFGGSPGFESALDAAGIDGGRRGETLAIGEFVRLAELLQATEAQ